MRWVSGRSIIGIWMCIGERLRRRWPTLKLVNQQSSIDNCPLAIHLSLPKRLSHAITTQHRSDRRRAHWARACRQPAAAHPGRARHSGRRSGRGGRAAAADDFGIKFAVAEYQTVLQSPAVDAVVICSATHTHATITMEAAAAGKHIFCEKPMDFNLAVIDEVLAAVKQAGVKLQIGFNRRFDANFARVRQAVSLRRDRHAAPDAHHQPRPGAAAARLHRGLGRHVPGHDDPRLRHGALSAGRGGDGGLRRGRRAGRPGHRRAGDVDYGAGHAQVCQRRARRDRQQPPGRLRLRPARRDPGQRAAASARATSTPTRPRSARRRRSAATCRSTSSWSATPRATSRRCRPLSMPCATTRPSPPPARMPRAATALALAARRSLEENKPVGV